MKNLYKLHTAVMTLLLLAACAAHDTSSFTAKPCDLSWLKDGALPEQKACELRVLANRCAVSDQCLIACEAKGGPEYIAGGCAHVCSGGSATQSEADIATNGGTYATSESIKCHNQAR